MRKPVKVLCAMIVIFAAALAYAWPWIKMEFASSAHYSEQDTREYAFYTPDLLKTMPRISPRYDFDFASITGPASHVSAIRYYGTRESGRIDHYLSSKGYIRQDNCHIEAVCWRNAVPGDGDEDIVTVSILENPDAVLVSVIHNF